MNKKTKVLNVENNKLDRQISKENQGVFTDMICYLRGANISEYDVEVARRELTEKILTAQKQGLNIKSVVGDNYKEFCDSVIENLPPRTIFQKCANVLSSICLVLSIVFTINTLISKDMFMIIKNMIEGKSADLRISFSVGSFVSMLFIVFFAYLIVNMIMKNALSKETKYKGSIMILSGILLVIVMAITALIGRGTLFTINLFYAYAIIMGLYVVHKLLDV